MSIEVKVYSSESKPKIHKKPKAKILTPEYVRQLNKGISERIISSQNQNEIAVRSLSKRKIR